MVWQAFLSIILFLHTCVCGSRRVCHGRCVEVREELEFVFPSHHVGPRDQAQVRMWLYHWTNPLVLSKTTSDVWGWRTYAHMEVFPYYVLHWQVHLAAVCSLPEQLPACVQHFWPLHHRPCRVCIAAPRSHSPEAEPLRFFSAPALAPPLL